MKKPLVQLCIALALTLQPETLIANPPSTDDIRKYKSWQDDCRSAEPPVIGRHGLFCDGINYSRSFVSIGRRYGGQNVAQATGLDNYYAAEPGVTIAANAVVSITSDGAAFADVIVIDPDRIDTSTSAALAEAFPSLTGLLADPGPAQTFEQFDLAPPIFPPGQNGLNGIFVNPGFQMQAR